MSATQEVGNIFGAGSGPANAMMRSPTVLIASVGLWGMNVFFFRLFGIDYVKVLKHDLIQLGDEPPPHSHHRHSSSQQQQQMPAMYRRKSNESDNDNNNGDNNRDNNNNNNNMQTSSVDNIGKPTASPLTANSSGGISSLDGGFSEDEASEDETTVEMIGPLVMNADANSAITWGRLMCLSMLLLLILHVSYFYWIDIMGGSSIGAIFTFYGAVAAAIAFPLPSTKWLRKATLIVLHRSFELINPRCHCCFSDSATGPRPVPFVDVFFADAMCSLSKVFFDWGMLLHMAAYYPSPVPPSAYNILVPSAFAAIPFLIRARQCLVMYTVGRIKQDPNRFDHLWNALKYSTSIFPLCMSAYQKTLPVKVAATLDSYLIILLVINALYALYWDIVMDWGMMKYPSAATAAVCSGGAVPFPLDQPRPASCVHAFLRPRLRFGLCMSALIVVLDAVLRFAWTLRFWHKLFPNGDSFVLFTQFLEVFRRAIWNLLRVEWENLKIMKAGPVKNQLLPPGGEESMVFLQHIKREK